MRNDEKMAHRLLTERARTSDTRSQASHRSHRSRTHSVRPRQIEGTIAEEYIPPPLTAENLSQYEGSVVSAGGTSRNGPRRESIHDSYQESQMDDSLASKPSLARRHTDIPLAPQPLIRRPTLPEMQTAPAAAPTRKSIDMDLAYGEMHASHIPPPPEERELELDQQLTRLDSLLVEAQCISHSATSIIQSLQKNPDAMAAVALTLAEISNLVKVMSPGILTAIKASSPAIFALLICPEFLIATGLAVGVTIVMFGGFKIIKKIQDNNAAAAARIPVAMPAQQEPEVPEVPVKVDAEGNEMDEAIVYEAALSSVETWIRGVAESTIGEEVASEVTSVDGEFITPEAASIRRMRTIDIIRQRAMEERKSVIGDAADYKSKAPAPSLAGSRRHSTSDRESVSGKARSERSSGTRRHHHRRKSATVIPEDTEAPDTEKSGESKKRRNKEKEKEKRPSVLKVLFMGKSEKVRMMGA